MGSEEDNNTTPISPSTAVSPYPGDISTSPLPDPAPSFIPRLSQVHPSPPGWKRGWKYPGEQGLGRAGQRSFDVGTTKAGAGGKGNRDAGSSGMHFKRNSESFEDQFLPRKQTALLGLLQSPHPAKVSGAGLCSRQPLGSCLSRVGCWGARGRLGLLLRRESRNYRRVTSPSWPQGEGESRSEQSFTGQLMSVLPRWMQSGCLAEGGKGTGGKEETPGTPRTRSHRQAESRSRTIPFPGFPSPGKTTAFCVGVFFKQSSNSAFSGLPEPGLRSKQGMLSLAKPLLTLTHITSFRFTSTELAFLEQLLEKGRGGE